MERLKARFDEWIHRPGCSIEGGFNSSHVLGDRVPFYGSVLTLRSRFRNSRFSLAVLRPDDGGFQGLIKVGGLWGDVQEYAVNLLYRNAIDVQHAIRYVGQIWIVLIRTLKTLIREKHVHPAASSDLQKGK